MKLIVIEGARAYAAVLAADNDVLVVNSLAMEWRPIAATKTPWARPSPWLVFHFAILRRARLAFLASKVPSPNPQRAH
jgi:hypothetical protein